MDRKKWMIIMKALRKIKCKLTCCCQSTCNQPEEDRTCVDRDQAGVRTILRWIDNKGVPHKQVII